MVAPFCVTVSTHIHAQTHSHTRYKLCGVLSPYVNRKSGGKTRYREEILCLNAKLCMPFSLSCSYFLCSAPLNGSDSAPSSLLRLPPRVFVQVGVILWVCTCQFVAHIYHPCRAWGKMTRAAFVFVPSEFANRGEEEWKQDACWCEKTAAAAKRYRWKNIVRNAGKGNEDNVHMSIIWHYILPNTNDN